MKPSAIAVGIAGDEMLIQYGASKWESAKDMAEGIDLGPIISRAYAVDVAPLVAALENAKTVLGWFGDERHWTEEMLSEGVHFIAEWKIGFDPMELARQATERLDAALARAKGETP